MALFPMNEIVQFIPQNYGKHRDFYLFISPYNLSHDQSILSFPCKICMKKDFELSFKAMIRSGVLLKTLQGRFGQVCHLT